jgi:hypothetical protein
LLKLQSKLRIEQDKISEYQDIVQSYAQAEGELIKARYHYNNLDRYISFKQTELKLDVALANKQPM